MQGAVESRGGEDQLIGPFLGVLGEFLQGLVGLLVVDQQHARIGNEPGDRNEVGAGEFGLPPEQLVDLRESRDRDDVQQQRVAVGLGGGGELRPDRAGRARLGLDHHRLLEDRLEHRRVGAAHHVSRAAGREGVDQRDGVRRVGVLRRRRAAGERSGGRADHEVASVHGCLPVVSPRLALTARAPAGHYRARAAGATWDGMRQVRLRCRPTDLILRSAATDLG